jgi:hypothetical protein
MSRTGSTDVLWPRHKRWSRSAHVRIGRGPRRCVTWAISRHVTTVFLCHVNEKPRFVGCGVRHLKFLVCSTVHRLLPWVAGECERLSMRGEGGAPGTCVPVHFQHLVSRAWLRRGRWSSVGRAGGAASAARHTHVVRRE